MDFGLDRLLVALEERFGKKPTDAFVLMVALAVVVFCFAQIWDKAIEPLATAIDDFSNGEVDWWSIVRTFGITVGLTVLAMVAIWFFGQIMLRRVVGKAESESNRLLARVDDAYQNLKKFADQVDADGRKVVDGLQTANSKMEVANETLEKAKATLKEASKTLKDANRQKADAITALEGAKQRLEEAQAVRQSRPNGKAS